MTEKNEFTDEDREKLKKGIWEILTNWRFYLLYAILAILAWLFWPGKGFLISN